MSEPEITVIFGGGRSQYSKKTVISLIFYILKSRYLLKNISKSHQNLQDTLF